MPVSNYLPDGIGGSLGDSLATSVGMFAVATTWYVSSVSGSDTTANGRDRSRPFATLAYAISQASAQDIVVLLQDHSETLVATTTINKEVVIVGEGSAGGVPTASIWGNAGGTVETLVVSAARVEIRNVKFRPQLSFNSGAFIDWTGADGLMKGCYLESDRYDNGAKLLIAGDRMAVDSTTFISVATSVANRPEQAINTTSSALTLLRIKNSTISGGVSGWNAATTSAYFQATSLQVRIEGLSLLLGSDIKLDADVTGFVGVPVSTGGAQVRWS